MEAYVLDDRLRRIAVVDQFESLIWTERWTDLGDFELVIQSTNATRNLLTIGTRMAINESYRVMTIDTVAKKNDADGRALLTLTGKSLENILVDRSATEGMVDLTPENQNWIISGTAGGICREVFKKICVDGILSINDKIPYITTGTIMPPDTIPEPSVIINAELPIDTVYNTIADICKAADLGFRLLRNFDKSQLYFDIYSGSDRTTQQNTLPPVVFSQELDNLSDVSELTTTALAKNVAYVFSKHGTEVVYADGADITTSGFDRRVLTVIADDIEDLAGPVLTALLKKRGADELAKNRSLSAFDGEISQYSQYKYMRDYNLGDLVVMRNTDGVTNNMRVTEQIFASDAQGDRTYPTLSIEAFITPGTWLAWSYSQVWDNANGMWDDV